MPLDRFIFALGIDGIGKVASKDLAARFRSMDALSRATAEELVEMENIGEKTAQNIVGWFGDEDNRKELCRLFAAGVEPFVKEIEAGGPFSGESIVLTGTLSSFTRTEAQKRIEELGGACQSSVTSKTTLVIAGESAGSKLDKAKKLGIKIIGEEQFIKILAQDTEK